MAAGTVVDIYGLAAIQSRRGDYVGPCTLEQNKIEASSFLHKHDSSVSTGGRLVRFSNSQQNQQTVSVSLQGSQ